jgi:segregation and condensation protein B
MNEGDQPGQPPHAQPDADAPGTDREEAGTTPAATVAMTEPGTEPATGAVDGEPGEPGPAAAEGSPASAPGAGPDLVPLIETSEAGEARGHDAAVADAVSADVVPDVADLPPAELRAVLEGVLFVATRPLSVERLQQVLPGAGAGYLEGFLKGLAERYDHENRGWELRHIAGGWQLLTRRALYPWVRQLERKDLPTKLSKSALETLAIVAYKQPITRGAVEDIRGVQCGPVLRQLMDLRLVLVCGRDEQALGRPLLYGTTDSFLSRFGLGRVEDLPRRHEFGT